MDPSFLGNVRKRKVQLKTDRCNGNFNFDKHFQGAEAKMAGPSPLYAGYESERKNLERINGINSLTKEPNLIDFLPTISIPSSISNTPERLKNESNDQVPSTASTAHSISQREQLFHDNPKITRRVKICKFNKIRAILPFDDTLNFKKISINTSTYRPPEINEMVQSPSFPRQETRKPTLNGIESNVCLPMRTIKFNNIQIIDKIEAGCPDSIAGVMPKFKPKSQLTAILSAKNCSVSTKKNPILSCQTKRFTFGKDRGANLTNMGQSQVVLTPFEKPKRIIRRFSFKPIGLSMMRGKQENPPIPEEVSFGIKKEDNSYVKGADQRASGSKDMSLVIGKQISQKHAPSKVQISALLNINIHKPDPSKINTKKIGIRIRTQDNMSANELNV